MTEKITEKSGISYIINTLKTNGADDVKEKEITDIFEDESSKDDIIESLSKKYDLTDEAVNALSDVLNEIDKDNSKTFNEEELYTEEFDFEEFVEDKFKDIDGVKIAQENVDSLILNNKDLTVEDDESIVDKNGNIVGYIEEDGNNITYYLTSEAIKTAQDTADANKKQEEETKQKTRISASSATGKVINQKNQKNHILNTDEMPGGFKYTGTQPMYEDSAGTQYAKIANENIATLITNNQDLTVGNDGKITNSKGETVGYQYTNSDGTVSYYLTLDAINKAQQIQTASTNGPDSTSSPDDPNDPDGPDDPNDPNDPDAPNDPDTSENSENIDQDTKIINAAVKLHDAMEGWGTSADTILAMLDSKEYSADDWVEILTAYFAKYQSEGKTFVQRLDSEWSGSKKDICEKLADKLIESARSGNSDAIIVLCQELNGSMEKLGTCEQFVKAVIKEENSDVITDIDNSYPTVTGKSLQKAIDNDFSFISGKGNLLEIVNNASDKSEEAKQKAQKNTEKEQKTQENTEEETIEITDNSSNEEIVEAYKAATTEEEKEEYYNMLFQRYYTGSNYDEALAEKLTKGALGIE